MTVRVGVVGAGLMGTRRAASASASSHSSLVVVADPDEDRAWKLATTHGCRYTSEWETVVSDAEIDAVAVCTVNKFLAPITVGALEANKHVLCEKPLGRNAEEAARMVAASRKHGRILKVGFTLRFHPALREAHRLCEAGEIGPLFFLRAVYGHGGRAGYAQEWRGDAELAGGGELLDQGIHLVDLARWFLGDFEEALGLTARWFWEIDPLEDNAFMLLRNRSGRVASLHASWTEWRNRFTLEVVGRDGFARVDGIGGSYGDETLTVGIRAAQSGPPAERRIVFDGPDRSWEDDWGDFIDAVQTGRRPEADGEDGLATMRIIQAIYDSRALTGHP